MVKELSRRRSGPLNNSNLAIAPFLALVQAPPLISGVSATVDRLNPFFFRAAFEF
jgi:hypothetical protein